MELLVKMLMIFGAVVAVAADNDFVYECEGKEVPDELENMDGILELKCHVPACEELNSQAAVCNDWGSVCPPNTWVGAIRRKVYGPRRLSTYQVKCCTHPALTTNFVSKRALNLSVSDIRINFPQNQAGDVVEVVSSLITDTRVRDRYIVGITTLRCGKTTTTTTTTAATTTKPKSSSSQRPKPKSKEDNEVEPFERDNGGDEGNQPGDRPPPPPRAQGHSPRGGPAGCFSPDTEVWTAEGRRRMDELRVGDLVLSSTGWDSQVPSYQPVVGFLHRDTKLETDFVSLTTESGLHLSLTPNHLLPIVSCRDFDPKAGAGRQEDVFSSSTWAARRVKFGDCLLRVSDSDSVVLDRVINVRVERKQGVFAPVTASGVIVVNRIQASCYSSVENHNLQHVFFSAVYGLGEAVGSLTEKLGPVFSFTSAPSQPSGPEMDGFPWWVRALLAASSHLLG